MRNRLRLLIVFTACCCMFVCSSCQESGVESSSLENSAFSSEEEKGSVLESSSFEDTDSQDSAENSTTEESSDEAAPPHEHAYGELVWNDFHHWQECACGEKIGEEEHRLNDDNDCVVCGMHYGTAGILYELSADETYYSVCGFDENVETPFIVYIPSIYDGKMVKEVGMYAFIRFSAEKIILPNTVENIGEAAFIDCENLTEITFGKGLKKIGAYAFNGCSSLKSARFPQSLSQIGGNAFTDCSNNFAATFAQPMGWKVEAEGETFFLPADVVENAGKYLTGGKSYTEGAKELSLHNFTWFRE